MDFWSVLIAIFGVIFILFVFGISYEMIVISRNVKAFNEDKNLIFVDKEKYIYLENISKENGFRILKENFYTVYFVGNDKIIPVALTKII